MAELFRDVVGFEGLYKVSNLGRVKSLKFNKEKILNLYKGTKGHINVKLYKDKKQYTIEVHKLVSMAFLNHKPKKGLVIDHINEDKTDNRLKNLQIITSRKNTSKSFLVSDKSSKYTGVYWSKSNKKWRAMIRINGKKKHLGMFENELDAHKRYQKKLNEL